MILNKVLHGGAFQENMIFPIIKSSYDFNDYRKDSIREILM